MIKTLIVIMALLPSVAFASAMGDLINNHRSVPVVEYENICFVAEYRLKQIQKDFSHNGFRALEPLLQPLGTWYENLAVEGTKIRGVSGVFNAWKASPSHNANLNLSSGMKYVCIRNENGYWVMIGWKPKIKYDHE